MFLIREMKTKHAYRKVLFLSLVACILSLVVSCGYQMVGSKMLPFNSVTIRPVQNTTYEPGLEDKLYNALANEFIHRGIEVRSAGGDVELEAVIRVFQLGAIATIDEVVKEQTISMKVDFRFSEGGTVTEFRELYSPIRITFDTEGSVSSSAANKERASDKACREIAREMVGRITLTYAK